MPILRVPALLVPTRPIIVELVSKLEHIASTVPAVLMDIGSMLLMPDVIPVLEHAPLAPV